MFVRTFFFIKLMQKKNLTTEFSASSTANGNIAWKPQVLVLISNGVSKLRGACVLRVIQILK